MLTFVSHAPLCSTALLTKGIVVGCSHDCQQRDNGRLVA